MPPEFFPEALFPGAKTAIVIGVPVLLPILETAPSVYYHAHYNVLNTHLDSEALKLSFRINTDSAWAVPLPRDGYSGIAALYKNPTAAFSHKHAAYHAGLGTFGRNNTLLTSQYGPRVRFTTILTSATLEELGVPEAVLKTAQERKNQTLCLECLACARACPSQAVPSDKNRPYPLSRLDKMKCAAYSGALGQKGIAPCGVCIKVCPVGEDRAHFGRKLISIYDHKAPADSREEKIQNSWAHIRHYGTK